MIVDLKGAERGQEIVAAFERAFNSDVGGYDWRTTHYVKDFAFPAIPRLVEVVARPYKQERAHLFTNRRTWRQKEGYTFTLASIDLKRTYTSVAINPFYVTNDTGYGYNYITGPGPNWDEISEGVVSKSLSFFLGLIFRVYNR